MKHRYSLNAAMLLLMPMVALSQNPSQQNLEEFIQLKNSEYASKRSEALSFAETRQLPLRIENDALTAELIEVSNGIPQYYQTTNDVAARSISTSDLLPGGATGYGLDGHGIVIRQWDASGVLTSHRELDGRAVQGDQAAVTGKHASHVAGTMVALGADPYARGMAPGASVKAFRWNNDIAGMAQEALDGALLSNHSYGFCRGWWYSGTKWNWAGNDEVSDKEDYLFGFYDEQAREWDLVTWNAPYYLPVKSAGNDHLEGPDQAGHPQDGPWDCISHASVAKNILTVGAVNDLTNGYSASTNIAIYASSSYGPVDDGRIKPDLVANGIGLYSCSVESNESYATMSGTSMATPTVTGSLALLQQLYHDLNGTYMKAATLKALAINTADEAGDTPGPDYRYGWGLMNTRKAAQQIMSDQNISSIIEETLLENEVWNHTILCGSNEWIKVTVVWTDPPAEPMNPGLDNPTPMLVNDLDLKITRNGNEYFPWRLDPLNPGSGAVKDGKNRVDNVETVFIEASETGDYTIELSNNATLAGGQQDFSIIISKGDNDGSANLMHKQQLNGEHTLGVYPNPATSQITVTGCPEKEAQLRIYNTNGQCVQNIETTTGTTQADVSGLEPGLYWIMVNSEGYSEVVNLVKR